MACWFGELRRHPNHLARTLHSTNLVVSSLHQVPLRMKRMDHTLSSCEIMAFRLGHRQPSHPLNKECGRSRWRKVHRACTCLRERLWQTSITTMPCLMKRKMMMRRKMKVTPMMMMMTTVSTVPLKRRTCPPRMIS